MTHFDQEGFNKFILDNEVIGFYDSPRTLASGKDSYWYVNWRKTVTNDCFLMEELTAYIIDFVLGSKQACPILLPELPDCFYGIPDGATKIGLFTQYKWAKQSLHFGPRSHTLPMGRKEPKGRGDPNDTDYIGAPLGKIIALEDVVTTGTSLLQKVDKIRATKPDCSVIAITTSKRYAEIEYLGVLVFGKKSIVEEVTKQFKMYS